MSKECELLGAVGAFDVIAMDLLPYCFSHGDGITNSASGAIRSFDTGSSSLSVLSHRAYSFFYGVSRVVLF